MSDKTIPGSRDPRPAWMGESEPWWLKAGRQAGLTDEQARAAWEAFLRLKGVTLKEVTTHILIDSEVGGPLRSDIAMMAWESTLPSKNELWLAGGLVSREHHYASMVEAWCEVGRPMGSDFHWRSSKEKP